MIKTIRSIANVGKIVNFTGTDNDPFRKLTLIYAENGRGKTTLVDILRSMQSGEGHYITARRTLGASGSPEVSILLEPGTATFHDGRWDRTLADIEIFDDTFIHENVYAGDVVGLDHKKNLYRVIVGEEGVKLARKVDELDAASREMARDIRETEQCVVAYLPKGISLEVFTDLPRPYGDFDAKLSELQAKLSALQRDREIRETGYLRKILLPALLEGFFEVLAKELSDVSKHAEQTMRAHMQQYGMDHRGEAWLEQGLKYTQGGLCPFCEQKLTGNALIESYQAFFGASYRNLKSEIDTLRDEMEKRFGEHARLQLERDIADNRALRTFWRQFVTLHLSEPPCDDLQRGWHELRTAAQKHLERKRASPLERVSPEPDLEAAHKEWTRLSGEVKPFNEAVDYANTRLIARMKQAIDTTSLEEVVQEVAQLQATKIHHTPEADKACRAYKAALQKRKELEDEKKAAKKKLDDYTKGILPRYERRITELLKGFKTEFGGGRPSASYDIDINKTQVGLGTAKIQPGTPCFKNTLSSGDRSTLALVFFLARLQDDPRLAEKIVVFDDPITNQDDFRSAHTQQLIRDLYDKTKQLVVLSHDPRFLRGICGNVTASDVSALKISPTAENSSTLGKWEIEGTT